MIVCAVVGGVFDDGHGNGVFLPLGHTSEGCLRRVSVELFATFFGQ